MDGRLQPTAANGWVEAQFRWIGATGNRKMGVYHAGTLADRPLEYQVLFDCNLEAHSPFLR